MIHITGDTHGKFHKFWTNEFPEGQALNRDDYVIICGDFGAVWDGEAYQELLLDSLAEIPFTILFVSGNHENFELLSQYPITEWNGGKVQLIRPNVIHLMRGQIYNIDGSTFFTMGGARSHDIYDGILEPDDPEFEEKFWRMRRMRMMFRVNHYSWWKEELPSDDEYKEARNNLRKAEYKVDYIITHCAPDDLVDIIGEGMYDKDPLTHFLEEVRTTVDFKHWYFGHYHDDRCIGEKFTLLYDEIIPLD